MWPVNRWYKYIFAFLLSILFGISANAQTVTWSNSIDVPKSENLLYFTLVNDTVPAIVSRYGESLVLRTFSEDGDRPIFIRSANEQAISSVQLIKDRVALVEHPRDDSKELTLRVYQLFADLSVTEFNHSFQLSRYGHKARKKDIVLAMSDDAEKIAICQQEHFTKERKAEFNVLITDLKNTKVFHLPSDYESDDIVLLGATIDTQGIVYMGMQAGVKLNSPFRRRYLVYSFNPQDSVLTEFDLSSQDVFIRDIVINAGGQGLELVGLYSSDPLEEKAMNGYIYVKITPNGKEIERRIVSTFSESVTQLFEGKDASPSESISHLHIDDVYAIGGTPVIGIEKRFQDQICTADPRTGMLNCTDQFHFNALTLIDVLSNTSIVDVDKRQLDYDQVSRYSKHTSIATGGNGRLIMYNDHPKNEGLKASKIMNNPNRSVIRYVDVGPSAHHTTATIIEEARDGYIFSPKFGLLPSNNSIFLLSINNRSIRVGSVNLGIH